MENFIYQSDTRIIFGDDVELKIANEVLPYGKKVLLHYGGNSIKRIGPYDRIRQLLNLKYY
jgi:alcohol dehydrogenase YqhD (iron-dependent ADH family)